MRIALRLFPVLLVCLTASAQADLKAYLSRPEAAYRWEKRGVHTVEGGKVYDLHLVSQTWQGITWDHRLQLYYPDQPRHAGFCTLLNTGGNGDERYNQMGLLLARRTGAPFAVLYGIPKQPLYGGKVEDELVVYTWMKFMETGDPSWPLHFPMAKAVLKAMDALGEFSAKEGLPRISEYLVTGASKRGWTTWLVGASGDPRVKAIAPMVIDVLNVPAQVRHMVESYGAYSEQVEDYTRMGIQEKLNSPQGRRLMELEDPYSYRDVLTLPKLLILGTNDRYWTQDALNLYWDDLKGPKWVLYVPNSGHGLEDKERVFATLSAFARSVASHSPWPQLRWSWKQTAEGATLDVRSSVPFQSGRLFSTAARTRDFRDSRWTSTELAGGPRLSVSVKRPESGFLAAFVEMSFEQDGQPFTLSTQLRIQAASGAGAR